MYVEKLEIQNFRCFEQASLELNYPGRTTRSKADGPRLQNVNLLLGGNGTGKSSVFQALILSVLARVIRNSGFNAEYLVRRHATSSQLIATSVEMPEVVIARVAASLRLDSQDIEGDRENPVSARAGVTREGDVEYVHTRPSGLNRPDIRVRMFLNDSPAFLLVGYGASRRTERPEGYSEGRRSPRYQRVAGLFEDHVGLVPFTLAHLQLRQNGYLEEAQALLNSLLPENVSITDRTDDLGRPLFQRLGISLPFSALSDGYRAFIGWVWDLLFQLGRLNGEDNPRPTLTGFSGVVIVDEIDLFLHPEWQRTVVEQVATAFPKLQFLFSTHSPLVAGSLEPANIFVLDGEHVEQYREEIHGLTASQVLTSSYFGLRSTRAPNTGTLADHAERSLGINTNGTTNEEAEPEDLALDPKERARRMLEEIGDA